MIQVYISSSYFLSPDKQLEYKYNDLFWYGKMSSKQCLYSHVSRDQKSKLNEVSIYEIPLQDVDVNYWQ